MGNADRGAAFLDAQRAESAARLERTPIMRLVRRAAAAAAEGGIVTDQATHSTEDEAAAGIWPEPLDLEALAEREPEPPNFIMEGVPAGCATLVAGHGGAGKSSIELMRAVCIAAGVPFCGLPVERRRVMYLSCEDRAAVLHWRLTRICAHLGVGLASLRGWLEVLDLVGANSILWERDPRTNYTATPAYAELARCVKEHDTEVLFIDGIADVFGGNENARSEVKRFVNSLVAPIPAERGAVILIGHVNKATAGNGATGEGYSGSTGWNNSVRSRWYLHAETAQGEDGERAERTGKLLLELQKANHGETGVQIEFEWDADAHLFLGRTKGGMTEFDRRHQAREEQAGILRALQACAASSPPITVPATMQGPRTAYHALSQRPEFPDSMRSGKPSVRRFWRHIEALRQIHAIEETGYRRANRHVGAQFVLTAEGARQCVI